VEIITSVWPGPGYCVLGLASSLVTCSGNGKVSPPGTQSGAIPTDVSFKAKGAEVRFEQDAKQANALSCLLWAGDAFAFMSLGPTNRARRALQERERASKAPTSSRSPTADPGPPSERR